MTTKQQMAHKVARLYLEGDIEDIRSAADRAGVSQSLVKAALRRLRAEGPLQP